MTASLNFYGAKLYRRAPFQDDWTVELGDSSASTVLARTTFNLEQALRLARNGFITFASGQYHYKLVLDAEDDAAAEEALADREGA